MEERVVYEIPGEFSDEDRWFKFFNKRQALMIGVSIIFAILVIKGMTSIGLLPVGVIIGIFAVVFVSVSVMVKIPEMEYLRGGGQTLDVYLIKRFKPPIFI